jgi:hypothetical protein
LKNGDVIMTRRNKLAIRIAALTIAWLAHNSAMASTFLGEIPAGYSDSRFQLGGGTSSLVIDINALGFRDPSLCNSCNSIYADNFTVNLFSQAGALLKSINATDFLYYSMYSSSHGIGAGPVWVTVPAGAATLEIVSQLSIAGLLGSDGQPLNFGYLNLSTDGSISAAATPIPTTLPLLATGLAALGLLGWQRRQKAAAGFTAV